MDDVMVAMVLDNNDTIDVVMVVVVVVVVVGIPDDEAASPIALV